MANENQTTVETHNSTDGDPFAMYSTLGHATEYILSVSTTFKSEITAQLFNATKKTPFSECATRLQTMEEFLNTSSTTTLSMVGVAGVSTLLTWALFIYGCSLIRGNANLWLKKGNYMMTISIYPVLSSSSFLGILFPASSILCQAMDAAYLAVVLWKMAGSMIAGLGGREGVLRLAAGTKVSLRSPPCCCCCVCLPSREVSSGFISGVMTLMLQCLFVRPMLMGLASVLWANGTYDPSSFSLRGSFLYVTIASTASFLLAMYGLSLLLRVTKTHLTATMVAGRFLTLILVILSTSVANVVINILTSTGVIRCTINATANQVASGYFHFTCTLLILALCTAAVCIYRKASGANAKAAGQRLLDDDTEQLSAGSEMNAITVAAKG